MNFKFTKLFITIIAVFLLSSAYFVWATFAGTTWNVTLTTNPDLERGLVGHWTFDGPELLENAVDRSGSGNTGYLDGFAATTTDRGRIGQGLRFDGVDDRVEISDIDVVSWTLGAWIFVDETSSDGSQRIIGETASSNNTEFAMEFNQPENELFCYFETGGTVVSTNGADNAIEPGNWYHVVCSYDNATRTISGYLDGSLDAAPVNDGGASPPSLSSNVGIGRRLDTSNDEFVGKIDDVRIWNRVLSTEEVKRLYQLGATTRINTTLTTNPDLERGLVGHWTFDGPSITADLIQDRSPNGNHGGFFGGATTTAGAAGVHGQGFRFDGVDDYVRVDSPGLPTTDFTYSLWAKLDDITDNPDRALIIAPNDGTSVNREFSIMVDKPNDVEVIVDESVVINHVTSSITKNEWIHIVATRNGSTVSLYENGARVRQGTNGAVLNFNACSLLLIGVGGGCNKSLVRFTDGIIDDVRIYDRALSAAEIKRLYELGK